MQKDRNIYQEQRNQEQSATTPVSRPVSCCITPSLNCNLRCKMCHFWESDCAQERLDYQEWVSLINSLDGFLEGRKEFTISGGEPLLYPRVLDFLRRGTEKGFTTVLCSNGFLIDQTKARQIVESGLREICLSLDSLDAQTHDFLRGVRGSHQKVMKALRYLNRYRKDLRITVITVISRATFTGIEELLTELCRDNLIDGMYLQAIVKPFCVEIDDRWYESKDYSHLWPDSSDEVSKSIDRLIALKRQGTPIVNQIGHLKKIQRYFNDPLHYVTKADCYLGDYTINVNSSGEVLLCPYEQGIGNVRQRDIKEIWSSPQAETQRRKMRNCERNCHNMVNCFFLGEEEAAVER